MIKDSFAYTMTYPRTRRFMHGGSNFASFCFHVGLDFLGSKDMMGQHCTIHSASLGRIMAGKRWRYVPLE